MAVTRLEHAMRLHCVLYYDIRGRIQMSRKPLWPVTSEASEISSHGCLLPSKSRITPFCGPLEAAPKGYPTLSSA
jgi:hypothetical protein